MTADVLAWFTDPFALQFMQRSFLVTVVASVVCAVLSCWLVLVGWSLLGDAVSHSVLPGVVLSYALGLPFALGALVFGLGAVALIGTVRDTTRLKEDAVIGVVFTSLFALGLVLVSVTPSHVDLSHVLFGNLLGVTDGDIWQVVVLGVLTTTVLLVKRRDLTLLAFDPIHAHAIGLSPRRLRALLLVCLAVTVVVALQAVGVVLVVAMVIIPGATAFLVTDRFDRMLLVAPAVSVLCALVGTYGSYHLDTSTAGMVVLAQGVTFGVVHTVTRHRRTRRA
ncbi:metal ABC transporter permease [Sanguibacter sp. YZGR15]|uniref:Metal ABC transporter permease n=2 Tax=Sanguibacter suaedae TaxID=2795737 RepID=A0A934I533_9MICO|nr:metal ABC transporter permease [Sanguibacter suaedae]MBI9114391.1 metal ABC transporter permease [Sanguibacter suaedae]